MNSSNIGNIEDYTLAGEDMASYDAEYTPELFEHHLRNLKEHFWYLGRSRFILRAFERESAALWGARRGLHAIDLGGGSGGWVRYLYERHSDRFERLALADSSPKVLELANAVIPPGVERIQIDLNHLPWQNLWDVVFLFDVLEHIEDDVGALQQVYKIMRPGGLLFITLPALRFFWSMNDVVAHHYRRYSRADLERLAQQTGLELRTSRYFMFFLSPLFWLSRLRMPDPNRMTLKQIDEYKRKATHQLPPRPVNDLLKAVFAAETPLGHWLPFPWGTSVLGVFRKPLQTSRTPPKIRRFEIRTRFR
ncbi:MAG TPA: class I SAM-dependent methyltransferase [Candidatus Binataceae bacterium]|nr:class I SAM-dependent methyltransferase [Candidatus Binataceae bacterium]